MCVSPTKTTQLFPTFILSTSVFYVGVTEVSRRNENSYVVENSYVADTLQDLKIVQHCDRWKTSSSKKSNVARNVGKRPSFFCSNPCRNGPDASQQAEPLSTRYQSCIMIKCM